MGFDMNYSGAYQKYFSKEHDLVRKSIREFIRKEVLPNINEWEENGAFPKEMYKKAGDLGLLGIGYPDECGGTPGDVFM